MYGILITLFIVMWIYIYNHCLSLSYNITFLTVPVHKKLCQDTIWVVVTLFLQNYNLKINHIKGSQNIMADALSRVHAL